MTFKIIKKDIKIIFKEANLEMPQNITKIDIGFSNLIYVINNKFVLKVRNKESVNSFKRSSLYMSKFKDKLCIPKLIFVDNSKKLIDKEYIIYEYIKGNNLYDVWHKLSNLERKDCIKQICDFLKKLNKQKVDIEFEINTKVNWKNKIYTKIKKYIKVVKKDKLLLDKDIIMIENYLKNNIYLLEKSKMVLTYWDIHFDNIIIDKNKRLYFIDFGGIDYVSLDYPLNTIRRMVNHPKIYASKYAEKYIKKLDYKDLMKWYELYYKKMFNFYDLNKRINIYSIEYDLKILLKYQKSKDIRKRLLSNIK